MGLHSTLVAKSFPINCTWHQVNFSRFMWLSNRFEGRRLYLRDEGLHCCGITGDGWMIWNSQIYWLLLLLLLARVPTSATASDIKKAYYKLSLKQYVL